MRPARRSRGSPRYLDKTHRPLNCLAFLLPLLAAYEVWALLARPALRAQQDLARLLGHFGAVGALVPALVVVGVLLIWHVVSRQAWHVDFDAVAGMAAEGLAWAVPLFALWALLGGRIGAVAAGPAASALPGVLTGVGAAIYEEFVFRLAIVGLALLVLVDGLKVPETVGAVVAVALSAGAFWLAHPAGASPWRQGVFLVLAGVYLAVLYRLRGFGVAVGAHAAYNAALALIYPAVQMP